MFGAEKEREKQHDLVARGLIADIVINLENHEKLLNFEKTTTTTKICIKIYD